jgi:hypothetical protein
MAEKLALLGGPKAVKTDPEDAVLEVLRAGKMSGTDVTRALKVDRWMIENDKR